MKPADSVAARQARHFRDVERQLFEVLGGWVPTVPEPEVKLVLRAHSFQHAWHADLWAGLLPAGEPSGGPPDRPLDGAFAALAEPADTVARLMGAYRVVLPRLIAAYSTIRAQAAPAAGAPVIRAVDLMVADDIEAWQAGERLLQECLVTHGELDRGWSQAARVEGILLGTGNLGGYEKA